MFMGFILHIYIIFGTNLLTRGPAHIAIFLPISVFRRKGISNGVQTESNLRERDFWNERDPEDLKCKPRSSRGSHEIGGRPLSRGPLGRPPTYFFLLYIPTYPENIEEHHEILIPPPQPSISARSHLGAFAGTLPEGESTMGGFYINTLAPLMSCE